MQQRLSNTIQFSMLFEELFCFKIYDDFYGEDKLSNDFLLEPTSECLTLLKQYKLGCKAINGGIKIIHFKGRKEVVDKKQSLTSIALLHPKEGVTNQQVIPLISSRELLIRDFSGQLEDALGKVISKKIGNASLHLPSGYYTIKSGKTKQPLYFTKNTTASLLGIAEFYFSDLLKLKTVQTYTIQFQAKEVGWRFILVDDVKESKLKEIKSIEVKYKGELLSFTKPKKIELVNGRKAQQIQSLELYKLQQKVSDTDKIELCFKNTKRIIKIMKVKVPDIKMIKFDRTENKHYITKYVNL